MRRRQVGVLSAVIVAVAVASCRDATDPMVSASRLVAAADSLYVTSGGVVAEMSRDPACGVRIDTTAARKSSELSSRALDAWAKAAAPDSIKSAVAALESWMRGLGGATSLVRTMPCLEAGSADLLSFFVQFGRQNYDSVRTIAATSLSGYGLTLPAAAKD